MLIGFLTGAITSICTEPIDVVRTRLIAQRKGTEGSDRGTAFGYKVRGVGWGGSNQYLK